MPEFLNTPQIHVDEEDVKQNKVYGILSYIWILWLVGWIAAPKSRFARYHANQGLVFFVFSLALNVVFTILNVILGFLHLGFLGGILQTIVNLLPAAYMVFGIVYAAKGIARELPIIGRFHWIDKDLL